MNTHKVIRVDDTSFEAEVLRSERPVLVEFGARWCGPCRQLEPIVEAIAHSRSKELKTVQVDVDDSPEVAQRFGVRSVPTTMVFRGGDKVGQHVGLTTERRLLELVAASAPPTASAANA